MEILNNHKKSYVFTLIVILVVTSIIAISGGGGICAQGYLLFAGELDADITLKKTFTISELLKRCCRAGQAQKSGSEDAGNRGCHAQLMFCTGPEYCNICPGTVFIRQLNYNKEEIFRNQHNENDIRN